MADRAQFTNDPNPLRLAPDIAAGRELLQQANKKDMFRRYLGADLHILARTLWIISRFWMDHVREPKGLDRLIRADLVRGIHQRHFAALIPYLSASAE